VHIAAMESAMRPPARLSVVVLAAALAACTGSVGGSVASPSAASSASGIAASPSAVPSASAAAPTVGPSSSAGARGPWLRAWTTQALPPLNVFGLVDAMVITAGGIAVRSTPTPTVFPGPAVILLGGRQLTQAGLGKILARATLLGLTGTATDFGAPAQPGAATGHISFPVDGRALEITGNPSLQIECVKAPCDAAPGSPEAFGQFWQEVTNLDWLGADAAAQQPYDPPVYSVLVGRAPTPDPMLGANLATWPLAEPLASFGTPVANGTARCGTVTGPDANLFRAALAKANAQSQWVQSATTNATFGLTVRPLTDGQDACREVFGVG
jgi:hypothetical protein